MPWGAGPGGQCAGGQQKRVHRLFAGDRAEVVVAGHVAPGGRCRRPASAATGSRPAPVRPPRPSTFRSCPGAAVREQLRRTLAAAGRCPRGGVHDDRHAGRADQGADDVEGVGAVAVGDPVPSGPCVRGCPATPVRRPRSRTGRGSGRRPRCGSLWRAAEAGRERGGGQVRRPGRTVRRAGRLPRAGPVPEGAGRGRRGGGGSRRTGSTAARRRPGPRRPRPGRRAG